MVEIKILFDGQNDGIYAAGQVLRGIFARSSILQNVFHSPTGITTQELLK